MSETFRGWKRKTGLVTLILACGFAIAWVRSSLVEDLWQPGTGKTIGEWQADTVQHIFRSSHQGITWQTIEGFNGTMIGWKPGWATDPLSTAPHHTTLRPVHGTADGAGDIKSHWACWGFEYAILEEEDLRRTALKIPYWSIVGPLTLMSAWLLLFKRRRITSASQSPVPVPARCPHATPGHGH